MPTKGQIITNPTNGYSYEYLETAKDTNGERVAMKATIKLNPPCAKRFHNN